MNSKKIIPLIILLLSIGIANAQGWGGGSNSSRLITNVTDQVTDLLSAASYQGGNISNIAINTADIKSRVEISGDSIATGGTGATATATSTQTLTSSQINTNTLSNNTASKVNQLSGAGNSSTTNNIASTASTASANITATAIDNNFSATSIGAMNSGNVDITQASTNGRQANLGIQGLNFDSGSVSAGQLNLLNGSATFNPSVANLAINTSDISSEVKVKATTSIDLQNTSISAASVGAMNTGNITVTAPTPVVSTGHH